MKKKISGTFLISLLLAGVAFAGPSIQRFGGMTTVQLSPAAVQTLSSQHIRPSAITPGTLDTQFDTFTFPIPGGAIDSSTTRGDIFHTGGLAFDSTDTDVSMFNFIISTAEQRPVMNGLAAINGNIATRMPMFNLNMPQSFQQGGPGTFIITDVELTLTQTAADALNNAFGTSAFHEDFVFGNAVIVGQSLSQESLVPGFSVLGQ